MSDRYEKEVVQVEVKSGGSAEAIFSLSRRFLPVVAIAIALAGCGGDTGSVSPAPASSVVASTHSSLSMAVGSTYRHIHEDARVVVKSAPDENGEVFVSIGINGSQSFAASVLADDLVLAVGNNPDWTLSTETVKIQ